MTSPAKPLTLDDKELMRLWNEIKKWLEQARQFAGNVVDQWKHGVDIWVGRVRDILGDRPKLQAAIAKWAQAATVPGDVENDIGTAQGQLALWQGNGAKAFNEWIGRQNPKLERWKNTLGSTGVVTGAFAGALGRASAAVVDFLVGLQGALTTLVMGLVDAVGKAGGVVSAGGLPEMPSITVNPGAITMAVAAAVNGFIKSANDFLTAAANALNAADTAGNDFALAAASIAEIEFPGGNLDKLGATPVRSDR
jgi:hypothetical protein